MKQTEIEQLIFNEEMAGKLAALSNAEFGRVLRQYRSFTENDRGLVDNEIKRRYAAHLAQQADAKLDELEAMPLQLNAQQQRRADKLLSEVEELQQHLEAHFRARRASISQLEAR